VLQVGFSVPLTKEVAEIAGRGTASERQLLAGSKVGEQRPEVGIPVNVVLGVDVRWLPAHEIPKSLVLMGEFGPTRLNILDVDNGNITLVCEIHVQADAEIWVGGG
jgi:hypothetical protein